MSQLAFSTHWNPEEVGSNASEGMDLLKRREQAGKEQSFLLLHHLYRLPADGMAQIKGGSSYFKVSKTLRGMPFHVGALVQEWSSWQPRTAITGSLQTKNSSSVSFLVIFCFKGCLPHKASTISIHHPEGSLLVSWNIDRAQYLCHSGGTPSVPKYSHSSLLLEWGPS